MPKAAGFLPHFTRRDPEGLPQVHPGTEFSTVDTAIALHSLRLAAAVLDLTYVADAVSAQRRSDKRIMLSFDEWNVWYRTRRGAEAPQA